MSGIDWLTANALNGSPIRNYHHKRSCLKLKSRRSRALVKKVSVENSVTSAAGIQVGFPFERLKIDWTGPRPPANGYQYICTFM